MTVTKAAAKEKIVAAALFVATILEVGDDVDDVCVLLEAPPLAEPDPELPDDEPPLGLEPAAVTVALAPAAEPVAVLLPRPAEIPGEPPLAPEATAEAETTVVAEPVEVPVAVDVDEDALQERS